ncbi:shikimate kinase [Amycolatopsis antarctica]|uniref:Shikimate kinase n=1 Tax=Amycolatopsis antarctica TaxID=1854586 RepID=A0A263DBD0_9PSEU|nr:AAA family ATPase [Amycolatopsis antarctica]OZM74806.1 shikimate kinase [Amycolatopsis antarctica]
MTTAEVIVLTGSPGAGKTTVAGVLAGAAEHGVHLHADDFWHFIRGGAVPPYLPEAHAQNAVVLDVLAGAALRYASGGYLVVCDGIVGPWFLDAFREAFSGGTVALHYVVLRPDEETAVARAVARDPRGGRTLTDPEPVRLMHAQFAALGELEPHAIDTSGLDVDATVEAVRASVRAGTHRLGLGGVSPRPPAAPGGTAG